MENKRHLDRRDLYRRPDLPPELCAHLPLLLRHRSAFLNLPILLAAIVVLKFGSPLIGLMLLLVVFFVSIASFWVARSWLIKNGKWVSGTWYAEVLPGIHRAQSIFISLVILSGCGAYLVLGGHIVTPFLTGPVLFLLISVVPAYFHASIKAGFVANRGSITWRSESPMGFWLALLCYGTLMGLFIYVIASLLIHATYGP